MLKENSTPGQERSALKRQVAMGLDSSVQPSSEGFDLEQFMVDEAEEEEDEE